MVYLFKNIQKNSLKMNRDFAFKCKKIFILFKAKKGCCNFKGLLNRKKCRTCMSCINSSE